MRPAVFRSSFAVLLAAAVGCAPPSNEGTDAASSGSPDAGGTTDPTDAGGTTDPGDAGDDTGTPDAGGSETPDGGGTPVFPPKYTTFNASGTRLTAKGLVDASGNGVVAWFEDSQQGGAKCEVVRATDGKLRCLPFRDASGEQALGAGVFSESTCSIRLQQATTECAATTLKRLPDGTVVRLGTEHSGALYTVVGYDRNDNPICGALARPSGAKFFTTTTVDPSGFVEFTAGHVDVDARVGVQVLTGSDGASTMSGFFDVASGKPAVLYAGNRLASVFTTVQAQELVPSTCGGAQDAAIGVTQPTFNPDYVEVILLMGGGGGPGPGPGPTVPMPTLRKVKSAQNFHCRNGNSVNVPDGQSVFVLETATTDPTTLPLVSARADEREGLNTFSHYVTEAGLPVAPVPGSPSIAAARASGATGGPFVRGGVIVVPKQTFGSLENWFSDPSCATPIAPEGLANQGDLVTRIDPALCEAIPGLVGKVGTVYTVGALTPTNRDLYLWDGASCQYMGPARFNVLSAVADSDASFTPLPIEAL